MFNNSEFSGVFTLGLVGTIGLLIKTGALLLIAQEKGPELSIPRLIFDWVSGQFESGRTTGRGMTTARVVVSVWRTCPQGNRTITLIKRGFYIENFNRYVRSQAATNLLVLIPRFSVV